MERKTVFIFDCDGTTLDSFPSSQKILEELAGSKKFNVTLPNRNSREFKIIWGRGGYNMIKWYFRGYNPKEVHQEWKKIENSITVPMVLDAEEIIKKLKDRKAITGMVTNRSWFSLRQYPNIINLNLDFIQTSEYKFIHWLKYSLSLFENHLVTRKFKPNPKCFKPVFKWLERKKIKPEKIYYIGDSLVDFEAVRNANRRYGYNIEFIAVLTGPIKTRREWYEITKSNEKFLILRSVADLLMWLDDKEKEKG